MRHQSRAWLASLFFAAFSAQAVPRLYDEIASKHALSGEELYAYAVAQTGRVNEYRRVIPWPWTVMVNGYRYQFKTRLDLFNYLHNAQTGTASDIRFGIDNRKLGSQNRDQLWQELDVSAMLQRTALRLGGKSTPELLRMNVMPVLTAGGASRAEIDALIEKVSREVGLDPLLLHAVTRKESAYKVKATSHKGAMGLMQLMPDTAASLGLAPEQYYDPYANLWGGATYLKKQLDTFGSLELALAAYNAGPGQAPGRSAFRRPRSPASKTIPPGRTAISTAPAGSPSRAWPRPAASRTSPTGANWRSTNALPRTRNQGKTRAGRFGTPPNDSPW